MKRLALCLLCMSSSALAQAEESDQAVYLTCDAKLNRLYVGIPGHEDSASRGQASERISLEGLVTYSDEDERGDVHRTGAKTTERSCGDFTVRITGGFFNANTQGEMGAADDFALVEVVAKGKKIFGPVAMGECSSSVGRYSGVAACPDDWAVSMTVFQTSPKSEPVAYIRHVSEEYRRPKANSGRE